MHSAPPVGRGLDAGQELRSPQEASSLEKGHQGRHGRARDVDVRHRRALEQLFDNQIEGSSIERYSQVA